MKPVPLHENANAFEKRPLLIAVKNKDFSFHQIIRIPAKIIFSKLFSKTSNRQKPNLSEIEANDPSWFSNYE